MYQATLAVRVESAAKVLNVPAEKILTILKDEGIEDNDAGLLILDSPTTTVDDVAGLLNIWGAQRLKVRAAASLLKGIGLERPQPAEIAPPVNGFVEAMKVMRPIQQWNDRELLEKYNQDKDPEIEQELHKRSAGRNFIILLSTSEQGKEIIDIDNSLELLKQARKRVTPSFLPFGDQGIVRPIYPILSLNIHDRMIELCPICGETLFQGYCEKCQLSFSGPNTGIGDDERAYMKLVADSVNFEIKSHSDRKALFASASKGLEDLKTTWPSIIQRFEELKATNNLPKLRILSSRPTSVKDPFFTDGNRAFGNKTY